jgi:hypothetical protein
MHATLCSTTTKRYKLVEKRELVFSSPDMPVGDRQPLLSRRAFNFKEVKQNYFCGAGTGAVCVCSDNLFCKVLKSSYSLLSFLLSVLSYLL